MRVDRANGNAVLHAQKRATIEKPTACPAAATFATAAFFHLRDVSAATVRVGEKETPNLSARQLDKPRLFPSVRHQILAISADTWHRQAPTVRGIADHAAD